LSCAIALSIGVTCVSGPQVAEAALAAQPTELLEFEYQQIGASEEEAVRLAALRAVRATVVRAVHNDFNLQAIDRLEPYLQQNWPKYTASTYVLERRAGREGFAVRVRVTTKPRLLFDDLRSLRFLHLPNRNPAHFVFLEEVVEGQPGDGLGRISLAKSLEQAGFRVLTEGIAQPDPGTDVARDPRLMAAAREAATRLGADIIFTGRADTRNTARGEVFFDELHTFETRITIQQIRVADGTALGTRTIAERATFRDPQIARNESIRLASMAAAEDLGTAGRELFEKAALDQVNSSILLTNVTAGELEMIARHLEISLAGGTQSFVKIFYGNAAILNLATTSPQADIERAIQGFRAPSLRIVERLGRRLTVTGNQ
jgi:ethanolamine utilization microcompartment shell protein EutS